MKPMPRVSDGCPICGAAWRGGCQVPGKPFLKLGARVFYECGGTVSVKEDLAQTRADEAGTDPVDLSYLIHARGCNGAPK